MTDREPPNRRDARRRVCALFDDAVADDGPRGRRDAALVSVLFGAGVPAATAASLPVSAWDPAAGVLAWRREADEPAEGAAPQEPADDSGDGPAATVRRRAVEGAREALDRWLEVRGTTPGPLLCRLEDGGRPTCEPMEPADVRVVLQARARSAGVRTGSTGALRRLYESPWWEEVPRRSPDG